MKRPSRYLSIVVATLACIASAAAQERAQPPPSPPPEIDCHPAAPPTGGTEQGRTDQTSPRGNPTEKLARSGGVICPPAGVDRSIEKRAPETGRTPVIPPPGSPGSNSPIQPK